MNVKISRALLSVSDKSGILPFAQTLHDLGVEILSTGGTARLLQENRIPVTEVSDYTGFPEMMDGRLKTLHPLIHGGILGRRGSDEGVMKSHGINPIDLVVVNLYPFQQTVAKEDCTFAMAIENIDIGGPTMVRAAAKNHESVAIVVDPGDYPDLAKSLTAESGLDQETRTRLARKAFAHTAAYDSAIASYLQEQAGEEYPQTLTFGFERQETMRYGENPHQSAAFYVEQNAPEGCIASASQLQGKALSYNNIADADAALECVKSLPADQYGCVIVKHANPCGVALGNSLKEAYERAYQTDPTSAFGGIIAFNSPLDEETASLIVSRQFVEIIITPQVQEGAREAVSKKANIRLLETGNWPQTPQNIPRDFKRVRGGLLVQQLDTGVITESDVKIVTQRKPSDDELKDLLFAWKVVKFVKSNAIVYCKSGQTIGIGAGQMSRVYSARIAAIKAADENLQVAGSVMASDAFFPFRDGIDSAAEAGIRAVIQPGGSMRDEEVIAAANEHDIAMVFTGMRHFRH